MNIASRITTWGDKIKNYDYRVAYFQRTDSSGNTGYFKLPSIKEILNEEYSTTIDIALTDAMFEYTITCGFSPNSNLSGDKKIFGNASWFGLYIINGRWRPGGVNYWPTQPSVTDIPLIAGNSVKLNILKTDYDEGYVVTDSNNHNYSLKYKHGPHNTNNPQYVLISNNDMTPNTTNGVALGCRFFESTTYNNHPQYGFETRWIPVMKDDSPYIADTCSGELCPKTGGEIGIGPRVKDDWDPMTWIEPS